MEGKETNKKINQEFKRRDEKNKRIKVNQQGSVTIKEEKMEDSGKQRRRWEEGRKHKRRQREKRTTERMLQGGIKQGGLRGWSQL